MRRPLEHLSSYKGACEQIFGPACWDRIDAAMAEGRGTRWPAWCPIPAGALYAMVLATAASKEEAHRFDNLVPMLHCLALWRYGQGVYRFDDALATELLDTPLDAAIPSEVLSRLPEWCGFIVAPGCDGWPDTYDGFFAMVSWNADLSRRELRLVFLPSQPDVPQISIIPLNFETLGDALGAWYKETLDLDLEDPLASAGAIKKGQDAAAKVIGFVLYLCAENAEFRPVDDTHRPVRQPEHPAIRHRPRQIDVGYRVGPLLARQRQAAAATGHGAGVSPHLRRAHWHHYWTRPDPEGDKVLELRWLQPTLVLGRPSTPRVRDLS